MDNNQSNNLKRILAAVKVKQADGWNIARNTSMFVDADSNQLCPLGAVAKDKMILDKIFGYNYVDGFIDGVDGHAAGKLNDMNYVNGYRDGVKCRTILW